MADDVRAAWERVADAWDEHSEALAAFTAPVQRQLLDQLDPRPGDVVLEVAAGTGGLSRSVAERVAPDGRVVCSDLSPRMVEIARRRADELGLEHIELAVLDAERTGLPTGSVDAVVCNMGLMLMPDLPTVLGECRRVLRRGGRLAFSTWGPAELNPWIVLIGAALLAHGAPAQGDPTGPGGLFSMADAAAIRASLTDAGFGDPVTAPVDVSEHFRSFDAYWSLHTATGGPLAVALDRLGPEDVDAVHDTCESYAHAFRSDDGYAFPGQALVTQAS